MKKWASTLVLAVLLSSAGTPAANADNPVIKDVFTGDPAAFVHGDKVYLYTGHDEAAPNGNFFVMKDWLIFSSSDLVNWAREGSLDLSTFAWAQPNSAWASQLTERDGTFYWYVTVLNQDGTGYSIGVATSDNPISGFKDALGKPLVSSPMTQAPESMGTAPWDDIDPSVFIDDDGQAYLYWGNTHCYYAKLRPNMTELDGEIHRVTINNMEGTYTEAPWIHKHNGTYYLSFAHNYPEELAYATSSSPAGPWEYQGLLLDALTKDGSDPAASNTSHQSIIEFKGKSYLVYHNSALPTGGQYRRSVAIDRLHYNEDGTIRKVIPTSTGLDGMAHKLESYTNPAKYVRHLDGDVRLDPVDSSVFDSKWYIVPGLADSGAGYVSLQSVDRPGYYLRYSGSDASLGKHDGTPAFAESATFKVNPGLADASLSSFEAYSQPGHYLRHAGSQLKVEAVSGEAAEADATFRTAEADVRGLTLDQQSLLLQKGTQSVLTASVQPTSALNPKVIFTSSDPNVAAVGAPTVHLENGTVTVTVQAKSTGTATLTARTEEGRYTASADVTVEAAGTAGAITNVKIGVSAEAKKVTIEGQSTYGTGNEIAVRVRKPDGTVDFLDQTTSGDGGSFMFGIPLANPVKGEYQVSLGAADVSEPYTAKFEYTPAATGGNPGGGHSGSDSGGGSDSGSGNSSDDDEDSSSGSGAASGAGGVSAPAAGSGTASPGQSGGSAHGGSHASGPKPGSGKPAAPVFRDVQEGYSWAQEAIEALAAQGIIQGTSESTFEPGRPVSRADFITLLVRAFGLKGTPQSSSFADVQPGDYYYEAVSLARSLGLTDGVDGSRFDPQAEISRQDMMVLIARALKLTNKAELGGSPDGLKAFADAADVADYAAESTAALIQAGVIQGDGGALHPRSSATRAETAVMLHRIWNTFLKEGGPSQ
ncbi:family 43 glycosylhydrolase [Paenibacillus caseinilyticus]|uniref:Xylosidase n=1 Tax=Paenibacillus mucilaginosus K02 TaxID=997761 RepID=I0BR19_9BACL|nr:family 43 glycosylhydrolase [Paenibacillus mucilaginosus]AFH64816.1 xylosidase [Paenibacillus mucilaginosus K02]